VNDRKPKSCSFANILGCKKWQKNLVLYFFGIPVPVSVTDISMKLLKGRVDIVKVPPSGIA
jgi:hypothetical protein